MVLFSVTFAALVPLAYTELVTIFILRLTFDRYQVTCPLFLCTDVTIDLHVHKCDDIKSLTQALLDRTQSPNRNVTDSSNGFLPIHAAME